MFKDLTDRQMVVLGVIVVAVIGAYVTLTVAGFGGTAVELPVLVGGIVAVLTGQQITHTKINDTRDKVEHVLNGGMTDNMRRVMREEITKLAAEDETHGTTQLSDALRRPDLAPPEGPIGHPARRHPIDPHRGP